MKTIPQDTTLTLPFDRRLTHGKCPRGPQPKKYTAWRNIKARTGNPKNPYFKDYGGRGITMYKPWYDSFEAFDRDVPDPPHKKSSIERKDNEKGYEPGNVVWADRQTQQNNTRQNVRLTHEGRTQTIAQWSRETGLKATTIRNRIYEYGWSVEEALTMPVGGQMRTYRIPMCGRLL